MGVCRILWWISTTNLKFLWKKLTKKFKFSAYREGDFHNIWTPRDSQGFKCGVDSTVKDKPYLVFFDIKECASPSVLALGCNTPQVCVKKCPEKFFLFDKNECNKKGFNIYKENMICKYNVNLNSCDDIESAVKSKECAEYYLKSQPCKSRFSFWFLTARLNLEIYSVLVFNFCVTDVLLVTKMCTKIPETNGSTTKIVCDNGNEESWKFGYEYESIASKFFKDSIEIFSPEENADVVRNLTAFGIKYWC